MSLPHMRSEVFLREDIEAIMTAIAYALRNQPDATAADALNAVAIALHISPPAALAARDLVGRTARPTGQAAMIAILRGLWIILATLATLRTHADPPIATPEIGAIHWR